MCSIPPLARPLRYRCPRAIRSAQCSALVLVRVHDHGAARSCHLLPSLSCYRVPVHACHCCHSIVAVAVAVRRGGGVSDGDDGDGGGRVATHLD